MPEDRSAFDEAYTAAVGVRASASIWRRCLRRRTVVAHSGAAGRSGNCRRLARRAAGLRTGEPVREATVDERGTRPDRIVVSIEPMSLLEARAPRRVRLRNRTPAPPPHSLPSALNPLLWRCTGAR